MIYMRRADRSGEADLQFMMEPGVQLEQTKLFSSLASAPVMSVITFISQIYEGFVSPASSRKSSYEK